MEEICFMAIIGRVILGIQSGNKYEKISKVILELLMVVYIVGALSSLIGHEITTGVHYENSENSEDAVIKLEKSIAEMQNDSLEKIKFKINNSQMEENDEINCHVEENDEINCQVEKNEETTESGYERIEIPMIELSTITFEGEKGTHGSE